MFTYATCCNILSVFIPINVSTLFLKNVTCLNFSSSAGLGSNSAPPIPDSRLGEENKGHQMLVKMGKAPGKNHQPLWAFGAGEPGKVPARGQNWQGRACRVVAGRCLSPQQFDVCKPHMCVSFGSAREVWFNFMDKCAGF